MGEKCYNELSRNLWGSWTGLARMKIRKGGLRVPFSVEKFLSNEDLLTSQERPSYTELDFLYLPREEV